MTSEPSKALKKKDFQKISYARQYSKGSFLKISYVVNCHKMIRMGLSISCKFGSSPKRNRFKRILREIFRKNFPFLPKNIDINISPIQTIENIEFSLLEKDFLEQMQKITNLSQ